MPACAARLSCVTLALLAACGQDAVAPPTDPRDVTFAAKLDIDLDRMTRSASGLYSEDVEIGTGTEARVGTTAGVLYAGWLPSGILFDSRTTPSNPFTFTIGIGEVIAGWDEGVNGMRVGGVRKLVIPPQLGYGNRPNGSIPANAVLVFEIELLTVNGSGAGSGPLGQKSPTNRISGTSR